MITAVAMADPDEPVFGGALAWSQPTTSAAGYPATVYFYGDRPTTIPLTTLQVPPTRYQREQAPSQ